MPISLATLLHRSGFASQRGAMFGMDARIALIVAAILTAAGGITIMSRLERSKVDLAEQGVDKLRNALLKYYQTVSINQMPDTLDPLFQQGLIDDPDLKKDPWGNPWYYEHFSSNISLEGTPITVQYAVIYSGGKDGVANSPPMNSEIDYAQWEQASDDVGTKVSTRDIEVARQQEYAARGQLIIDKIESAESAAFIEAQNTCASASPPGWCTDTDDKNYTQFNFYPVSSLDGTDGVVYYQSKVLNKPIYQSGDANDMQQMMIDLGLPATYARDPWGRIMHYQSNITERTDPPFAASICFSLGENCFTQRE